MENKEENTKSPVIEFIKGRIQQLLEDAEAVTKSFSENQERLKGMAEFIKAEKTKNTSLKAVDMRSNLVDFQMTHYNTALLDSEMKRIVTILGEDYTILKAMSETGDMVEEAKTILENYANASKAIFIIEKGVPRIAEEAVKNMVNDNIEKVASNEVQLEAFFNSPNFQPVVE